MSDEVFMKPDTNLAFEKLKVAEITIRVAITILEEAETALAHASANFAGTPDISQSQKRIAEVEASQRDLTKIANGLEEFYRINKPMA